MGDVIWTLKWFAMGSLIGIVFLIGLIVVLHPELLYHPQSWGKSAQGQIAQAMTGFSTGSAPTSNQSVPAAALKAIDNTTEE